MQDSRAKDRRCPSSQRAHLVLESPVRDVRGRGAVEGLALVVHEPEARQTHFALEHFAFFEHDLAVEHLHLGAVFLGFCRIGHVVDHHIRVVLLQSGVGRQSAPVTAHFCQKGVDPRQVPIISSHFFFWHYPASYLQCR